MNHSAISSFIWGTADLLRSSYKQHEYGDIILPFTVMRRLDIVLAPTKQAVLEESKKEIPAALKQMKESCGTRISRKLRDRTSTTPRHSRWKTS